MAGRTIAIRIILALCIAHTAWATTSTTTADPSVSSSTAASGSTGAGSAGGSGSSSTTGAPTTTEDPIQAELQLISPATDIETGLDKHFFVECNYNKTDKPDHFGVMSMKLEHKGDGKTEFEDIASIVINFGDYLRRTPPSVNNYKDLGGMVSGFLSPDGSEETFIKFEWVYPTSEVIGDFKCSVSTMDGPDTAVFEKTITITETQASLPTVIERVVNIDLNLDEIVKSLTKLDARALVSKNRLFHNELTFDKNTYYLAKNMWTSTVAAQTLCQIHGGYLVEIDDEQEWQAIKATLGREEKGPILIGATNKKDVNYWQFMRENDPITFADWSQSAVFTPERRCMTVQRDAKLGEGWKMNTIKCTGMEFESFMCEKPSQQA